VSESLTPTAAEYLATLGQARAAHHYEEHGDLTAARAFGWEGVRALRQAMYDGMIDSIEGVPCIYDPSKLPRPYRGRSYGGKK
jgi:hypothetical protein